MKRYLVLWLVLAHGAATAGELDDIKRVQMKPLDSVVLVDKGQQPRAIKYHFMAGMKRSLKSSSRKTVGGIVLGEAQDLPQEVGSDDSLFEAKSVAPDGTMTIAVTSTGLAPVIYEVTAQGKARVKEGARDDPRAAQLVASINASPMLLPAEPVGVGARWQVFSSVDMMGSKTDTVTVVTITKIDGDKISIHMVQDLRLDALALTAKMGIQNLKLELSNTQNVADAVLDLASPALVSRSMLVSMLEIKGTSAGKTVDVMFLKRMTMEERDKPQPAPPPKLDGTWVRRWAGIVHTMVLRADGGGDGAIESASVSKMTYKLRWRMEGDKLVIASQEKGAKEQTLELAVVGDVMVIRDPDPDARYELYKRK